MSNVETKHSLNNKQVVSLCVFLIAATFYVTTVYMSFLQLRTEVDAGFQHIQDVHGADLEQVKKDVEVLERRLEKKIKLLNEIEDNI